MSFVRTIIAIIKDFARYFSPKSRNGRYRLIALVVALGALAFFIFGGSTADEEAGPAVKTVLVGSVASLDTTQSISLIGTVEAVDQANLQTEASGRVTSVNVSLGQAVAAGQTIATLENASQYASLLQAQGAYEGALAAAAVSDVSVESAATALEESKNSARVAFKSAYNTANGILNSNVDSIYANPLSALPGIRIAGGSDTAYLNSTRAELAVVMPQWLNETVTIGNSTNLEADLNRAIARIDTLGRLIDTIISNLNRDADDYTNTQFAGLSAALNGDRASLNATRAALTREISNLKQAADNVSRAQLGGTTGDVSAANAQVKQALGSLRAAEAAYNKTIIRTPIAGVVNTLDLKVGDFAGQNAPAATIANNDALLITTFVGEQDLENLTLGQTVMIEGNYEGRITAIAPAINPATQKVEVKIQTESDKIANGDTVRIALTNAAAPVEEASATPLFVPLTAVKFTAENGSMFEVIDGTLTARPVTLGRISGDVVEITSGIDANTVFVIDARGLSAGGKVEAVTKN